MPAGHLDRPHRIHRHGHGPVPDPPGSSTPWQYISSEAVELLYRIPLGEVVIDFFDQLKSRTKGYASLDYEADGYKTAALVKVDLLITRCRWTPSPPWSTSPTPTSTGRKMTEKLRTLIPVSSSTCHPGRRRRPGHRPGDGESPTQRRLGQVLRGTSPGSASCSRSRRKARRR